MSALFHGLLLVDKPAGISSHDVVSRTRRIMGTKSVGHAGTLDPMATGLMVLLINEATKLSNYILEREKSYIAGVRLGVSTDTLDITGQVLTESPVTSTQEQILAAVNELQGAMELPIPMYSAAKIDGQKLYELARTGKSIEVPMKTMTFFDLQNVVVEGIHVKLQLSCSKGSFIRSWAKLLGERLGCGASLESLRRTASQPYKIENAMTLEEIESVVQKGEVPKAFIPMATVLPEVKVFRVRGQEEVLLKNGAIPFDLRARLISQFNPERDEVAKVVNSESQLLALIGLDKGSGFVLRRVFRY